MDDVKAPATEPLVIALMPRPRRDDEESDWLDLQESSPEDWVDGSIDAGLVE